MLLSSRHKNSHRDHTKHAFLQRHLEISIDLCVLGDVCQELFRVFGDSGYQGCSTQDAAHRLIGNKITVSVYMITFQTVHYLSGSHGVPDVTLFEILSFSWSIIIKFRVLVTSKP